MTNFPIYMSIIFFKNKNRIKDNCNPKIEFTTHSTRNNLLIKFTKKMKILETIYQPSLPIINYHILEEKTRNSRLVLKSIT